MSVGFISLGCPKNLVDSEVIAADVLKAGFHLGRRPERSDVVIVNTCAFIMDAKKEAVEAILDACRWKRSGKVRFVIVAGCLPQRYRSELPGLFPEVDAFIGVDQVNRAAAVIGGLLDGRRSIVEVSARARAVINPPARRAIFTEAPYAYLKIAEGCNHHCAFCAIPHIRGTYRSRPIGRIVREAETMLGRGIRELNLIAQDTTSYGKDLDSAVTLAALLRRLGRIGGDFWIRFLYAHPGCLTDDLLSAMAEVSQVCRYLDLPIQHCDGDILRKMGRQGNPESLRAFFAKIRAAMPDVVLRTTCLVGFPGETERAFQSLAGFINEIQFDHLGVFVYSDEEGTRSAKFRPKVAHRSAIQRKDELMRLQKNIVRGKLARMRGAIEQVMLEKKISGPNNVWRARSRRQAPDIDNVTYLGDHGGRWRPGMLVQARCLKSKGYDVVAEPV